MCSAECHRCVLQVDKQGRRIRRTPSLPVPDIFSLDTRLAMKERTIYLKGFDADTQLDELQEFMANFGKVCCTLVDQTSF